MAQTNNRDDIIAVVRLPPPYLSFEPLYPGRNAEATAEAEDEATVDADARAQALVKAIVKSDAFADAIAKLQALAEAIRTAQPTANAVHCRTPVLSILTRRETQNQNFDNDSAFGDDDDLASATTSLRSSIVDYHYENGRRYNSFRAGQYWGPNDEQFADVVDISHHVYTLMMDGKLFLAPVGDKPQRALDVGTGTGIWAIDFADMFPDCQVIGTDLSPTQPREVPPNLQFEVDDACSEWVFTKESFDYIHIRQMYGSVADWPKMYEEAFNHLKPGGWVEQLEISVVPTSDDGTVKPDSTFAEWGRVSLESGDKFGKTLRIVDESKQYLLDAGFEDVVEIRYKVPMAGWARDRKAKYVGIYNQLMWEQGLEGWCIYLFTNYLGWQVDEVHVFIAAMRNMLRDKSVHAYHEASVVYGRKPMAPKH